jgi:undecaprenyl-diphosphatase
MNFIDAIIPILTKLQNFSYLLVFLISFVESIAFIGLAIPGTVFNIFIGFLAGKGMFDIFDLFWFAIAGAILGDGASFYLGKRAKYLFHPENRIFKSNYLAKGEEFFKKHGPKSVLLGRFIGPIRPIIPFVAGMFKMKTKKFIFWNVLSAFAWAIFYLFLGYFLGQTWQIIAAYSTRATIFLITIVVFLILIYLLKQLVLKEGKRLLLFLKSILISIIQGITKNPEVINLVKNHPFIFGVIQRRIDRTKFTGLPLTLFILAYVYIISLFLGIIKAILKITPIAQTDIRLENLLYVFRQPLLIKIFSYITLLGQWQITLSIIIITSLIFWLWQKKIYIIPFIVTVLGTEIFVFLGKLVFERPRPIDVAYFLEKSYSFPSGHAAIACALFGFLIYYSWRNLKKINTKINLLFLGLIFILAIGFSRLYLGVHFLSDVLGGYLLGLFWLIIGINLVEWPSFKKVKIKKITSINVKIISASLIMTELIFLSFFSFFYKPEVIIEEETHQLQTISGEVLNIFNTYKLSKYTETIDGAKQEPLSFLIVAQNDEDLIKALTQSGWHLADPVSPTSILKIGETAFLNQSYDTAPMTPSFWNSNIHDFGFQKPTQSNTVRQRHHTRFWKTNFENAAGKKIYVGTASLDIGIKWVVVHTIKPDIDSERELLFQDLKNTQVIKNYQLTQFVDPLLGKNFAGDQFFTDGKIYVLELK